MLISCCLWDWPDEGAFTFVSELPASLLGLTPVAPRFSLLALLLPVSLLIDELERLEDPIEVPVSPDEEPDPELTGPMGLVLELLGYWLELELPGY